LTQVATDEWVRHPLQNKPTLTRETIQSTVIRMHAIRPSPLVDNCRQLIDKVELPDRNDRHVLAAAIASDARRSSPGTRATFRKGSCGRSASWRSRRASSCPTS